jgi:D-alanyl-D-alanine carboxypeptidase/D-alanyl-D-alanine-endopeptidase (penicillin-binding protein 4)
MRALLVGALAAAALAVAAPAQATVVVRTGEIDELARLQGDLILVAQGQPLSLPDLDALAAQVRAAGIARVTGDVIVDSRAAPIVVNGNRIALTVRPGPLRPLGRRAHVSWTPRPFGWSLLNAVLTVPRGQRSHVTARVRAGNQIAVRGRIAKGSRAVRRAVPVRRPDAFARSQLIVALQRARVQIDANTASGNPAGTLPSAEQVAADPVVAQL